ncbi:MAG: geranylgeranyl reductase family protein [Thermodesulfobacteriota bacterium]
MDESFLQDSFDLVIVGGGPAGSSSARVAAQKGLKVLIIDHKERIGHPVQCAELVSQWISHHLPFKSRSIIQPIESILLHFPDGILSTMKSPGYMLDRSLFDWEMVLSALQAGAKLILKAKALSRTPEGIKIQWKGKEGIVKAKVIIGADGANSTVRRWSSKPSLKRLSAFQYKILLFKPQSYGEIFFHPDYEGGYGWFFPKGKVANVGIGVISSKNHSLKELLHTFLDRLNKEKGFPRIEILSKTGGEIPCEPHPQIVFENVLLVGDAGGHCHPITGAGILNAVIGGEMAAKVAAEAILRNDLKSLKTFEKEFEAFIGKSLLYGSIKREELERNWNQSGMDFQELIKKTWVGFKEYYKGRRGVIE